MDLVAQSDIVKILVSNTRHCGRAAGLIGGGFGVAGLGVSEILRKGTTDKVAIIRSGSLLRIGNEHGTHRRRTITERVGNHNDATELTVS